MSLKPFNPQRFTDSQLYLEEADGSQLLVKAYLNEEKFARRDMEIAKNHRWRECGFRVPEIVELQCMEIAEPYVVMRFLTGRRLSEYLKDANVGHSTKLKTLSSIFHLNNARHRLALANNDLLLLHTDPNTDNIILCDQDIYFIDFEHISKTQDVLTGVGKEVATFARRIIKDMGIEHKDEVIAALLHAYQFNDVIMDKVEALTFSRPFQLLHRFKHGLRKKSHTNLVSRYDIADAIKNQRLFHKQ
jgi:tRNA A-37 threonylcarbamoyl transferase component Bud32